MVDRLLIIPTGEKGWDINGRIWQLCKGNILRIVDGILELCHNNSAGDLIKQLEDRIEW